MTLGVGIIGCGAISESHLEALREQPGAEVIACADVNLAAAQERADQFGIPHVSANGDVLLARGDIDLVSICVPPKWHADAFAEAAAAGKHILVEKPLAMDLSEADRMVDVASRSSRIAGVALVHRYLPAYHVLRDLVQGGAIGTVRMVRCSWGKSMYHDPRFTAPAGDPRGWLVDRNIAGGGILMSSSIHFLSAISFVLDNPAFNHVTARARRLHPKSFPGIEDEVDLWIALDGGTEFVLRDSWVCDLPYHAEFVGERGQLVVRGDNWKDLTIHGVCEGPVPAPYCDWLTGVELHADSPQPAAPLKPTFDGLVADVFESIERGTRVSRLPDVVHARNMQAVIAAAYQSQETGQGQAVDWRADP